MESSSAQRAVPGSQSDLRNPPADGSPPMAVDQPTVISSRPPESAAELADADAPLASVKLRPGSLLGHFELVEAIGGGGMGRVFRAIDTRLGRPVALKVLSRQQAADVETLLRFHNEARSAARLNHENIAQVYFVGEDQGLPFIASEFIEGLNLRDLVQRNGPLPLAEAVSYTIQVAAALDHAATCKVVHRDIKPSNVLVTPDGRVKLIDLGLARLLSRDDSGSDLTASGVTLGTFDYISPEQARDPRIADVRSDIYSLGCTLFYMLAGRPPFPQGTVLQKLLQHQGDEPPDVRDFRPELPEEVTRLLRKMMAKDPRRRYRDPTKLIVALWSLAEQIGLRPVGLGGQAWAVPKRRRVSLAQRHLPWAAPVAVLVVIVLVLDLLWSPPAEPEGPVLPNVAVTPEESVAGPPQPTDRTDAAGQATSGPQPLVAEATPQLSGEGANGTGPATPILPPGSTVEHGSGTELPGDDPKTESAEGSAPRPEPAPIVAGPDGSGGLRLAGIDGRISAAQLASVGLTLGADVEPRAIEPAGADDDLPSPSPFGSNRCWTVDPIHPGQADFSTLGAAFQAAADGDVVELRYDGRMEAKPVTLASLAVTLRAGQGFRPVLVFQPAEIDPIKYPRSMFSLTGTRLTISGVALELNVPRQVPADSWTMFEMSRADQIVLEDCSLTIRNSFNATADRQTAFHTDVAVFRLKSMLTGGALLDGGPATSRRASLRIEDCVVRGEAVVLRVEDVQPVELTWTNGLLVTTEWLVLSDGGERIPQPAETIQVRLNDLTAVLGAGLCRLDRSRLAPHQLFTQIECSRSILAAFEVGPGCLVEQAGVASVDEALWELDWRGQDCLYDDFAAFWRISTANADLPPDMTFDDWQAHWTPTTSRRKSIIPLLTMLTGTWIRFTVTCF